MMLAAFLQQSKRSHNQLRAKTTVESKESFIPKDFLSAIHAILVQHLTNDCTPLILHAGTQMVSIKTNTPMSGEPCSPGLINTAPNQLSTT